MANSRWNRGRGLVLLKSVEGTWVVIHGNNRGGIFEARRDGWLVGYFSSREPTFFSPICSEML